MGIGRMSDCDDCQKAARQKAIIGAAGGAVVGAGAVFILLRYVLK